MKLENEINKSLEKIIILLKEIENLPVKIRPAIEQRKENLKYVGNYNQERDLRIMNFLEPGSAHGRDYDNGIPYVICQQYDIDLHTLFQYVLKNRGVPHLRERNKNICYDYFIRFTDAGKKKGSESLPSIGQRYGLVTRGRVRQIIGSSMYYLMASYSNKIAKGCCGAAFNHWEEEIIKLHLRLKSSSNKD